MLMLMMIYPQLLVIRAHLRKGPFSQLTVTQAWNFRHTQKRRYRGALDALKMAVEAWCPRACSMPESPKTRIYRFAQLTGLEEGTTLAVHC